MPKVRDAIRMVERDGWHHVTTRGSHRQFRHPVKPGDDVGPKLWASIMKQAGLERERR